MNKKILLLMGILFFSGLLIGGQVQAQNEFSLKQRLKEFNRELKEKKAQGYDVTEEEEFVRKAKQAFDGKDYKRAKEFLDEAFETLERAKIVIPGTVKEEAQERLSQVKVASLYENINDGVLIGRSIDETIGILKETKADLIFRGFWKWAPVVDSPDNIPPELFELIGDKNLTPRQVSENLRRTGHYYQELKRWISAIKKEIPDIIFVGAIPAQTLARIELNPITGRVYTTGETWQMALDPAKWGIERNAKPVTKEQFQKWFYGIHPYGGKAEGGYDWRKARAYFPDITNPEFQELLLSWAKKQIDSGADAIWIDMLYHQVVRLTQITGDVNHPSVKESVAAASKIVDEIHKYGKSRGKYIYVGNWPGPFVLAEVANRDFPYSPPDVDFITISPLNKDVIDKKLDNARWEKGISIIKKKFGDIPVFAFIDWAFDESQTVIFSQKLSKEEQGEVLKTFDESFAKMGVNFVYPIHGGYMGRGEITTNLAWGKYRIYDALAPEFDTYETIKELARNKSTKQSNLILPSENNTPFNRSWLYEGPIYETHPYYYDGTFKGLTKKIPEIADLGVKTIYLMPIWERKDKSSNPISIYLINDYYKIDPAYGIPQDLKELVSVVHRNNMKILFDLVTCCTPPGSVVYNNDWVFNISFDELKEKAKAIGWTLEYETREGRKFVYSGRHQVPNGKYLYEFAGEIVGDRIVVHHFPFAGWGPAVDRGKPEVIDYFTKVAQYYVKEYDIDGWRVDAPGANWNPKLFAGDHSAEKLLKSAKNAITKVKPDAVFLSEPGLPKEVPAEAEYFAPRKLKTFLTNTTLTSEKFVSTFIEGATALGKIPALVFESHDFARINKEFPELNKTLLVTISTLPGVSFIQAGQEIGAKNDWFNSNSQDPKVDWTGGDYALRDFYKKVFFIQNSSNALKYGDIKNVWKSGDNTYAYLREYEDEKVIVVINFLDKQATSYLDLSFLNKGAVLYDELNDEKFVVDEPENFKISVPAYGSRILH